MRESEWEEWPRCAACGRLRTTVCLACGEAGTHFAPAPSQQPSLPLQATRGAMPPEPAAASTDERRLLVCPQCDSAFEPQYYRYCAWCGEDAGSGLDVEFTRRERLSPIGLWIVLAAGALLALVFWYFHWLLRP